VLVAERINKNGQELAKLRLGSVWESTTPTDPRAMPVPVALQCSATAYPDGNDENEHDNRYEEKCAESVHGVSSDLQLFNEPVRFAWFVDPKIFISWQILYPQPIIFKTASFQR
jgi:hypothetical protein